MILAHFHSLASFVFSCGVNQEVDQSGGHMYQAVGATACGNGQSMVVMGPVEERSKSDPKDIPHVHDTRQSKFNRL